MNILLDMNLSPDWVRVLNSGGHQAIHWSTVGAPNARDEELLEWALSHQHILFTHDLDFGAILAASNAESPSVIQLRVQDISPDSSGPMLLHVLEEHALAIFSGALLSIDQNQNRIRILPMGNE